MSNRRALRPDRQVYRSMRRGGRRRRRRGWIIAITLVVLITIGVVTYLWLR